MKNCVTCLASIFSLSREAAIGVRDGIVAFMNPAAIEELGCDCTNESPRSILPEHVVDSEAEQFVSAVIINGKRASVSASMLDDLRLFLLSFEPEEPGENVGYSITAPVRTLLSNINLATGKLAAFTEYYGDEKLKQCTSVLEHSYHQLRRLLLNVSTADALGRGDIPWLAVATDVRELCANITEATAFFAEKRGIAVTFDCEPASCAAVVDRELIEQMLLNLISNSLLHLEPGGWIKVTLLKSGEKLILSVDDNGCGIPPDILSTVFSRWKENKTLTETATGAGLGLGVARGIAEKHGGALLIESQVGKGTSVRVMLPADNAPADIFRSSETPYCLDNADPLLIQLSTWLPSAEYEQMLND